MYNNQCRLCPKVPQILLISSLNISCICGSTFAGKMTTKQIKSVVVKGIKKSISSVREADTNGGIWHVVSQHVNCEPPSPGSSYPQLGYSVVIWCGLYLRIYIRNGSEWTLVPSCKGSQLPNIPLLEGSWVIIKSVLTVHQLSIVY